MDLFFTPIEIVLNNILFQDPNFKVFLENHKEKLILINSIYINIKESGFKFSLTNDKDKPNLIIKFPFSKSIVLLIEAMKDEIDHTELELDGDLGLAQDFFSVFKNYDSFYLNKISSIFGDIFSYGASCFDSSFKSTIKDKHDNLKNMLICYLEDELQVIATSEEVLEFNNDVDRIRLDCDRLEARINNLISG